MFCLDCIGQSLDELICIQRNTVNNISETTLGVHREVVIAEANHTTLGLNLTNNFLFTIDNILTAGFYLIDIAINICDTNDIDLVFQCIEIPLVHISRQHGVTCQRNRISNIGLLCMTNNDRADTYTLQFPQTIRN